MSRSRSAVSGSYEGSAQRGVGPSTRSVASPTRSDGLASVLCKRLDPLDLEQHAEAASVAAERVERRTGDDRRGPRVGRPRRLPPARSAAAHGRRDRESASANGPSTTVAPDAAGRSTSVTSALPPDLVASTDPSGGSSASTRPRVPAGARQTEPAADPLSVDEPPSSDDEQEAAIVLRAGARELDRRGVRKRSPFTGVTLIRRPTSAGRRSVVPRGHLLPVGCAHGLGLMVILAVVVLLVCLLVALYNRFVQLRNRVDNSWAQIEVQLKRR